MDVMFANTPGTPTGLWVLGRHPAKQKKNVCSCSDENVDFGGGCNGLNGWKQAQPSFLAAYDQHAKTKMIFQHDR